MFASDLGSVELASMDFVQRFSVQWGSQPSKNQYIIV